MKAIVPDGYKQTVAETVRMRDEFCAAMMAAGWELIPGRVRRYRDASSVLD